MVDPQNRAFLSFEIKTVTKFFFMFFFCLSFKNNICTNVILISIFFKCTKKRYQPPKTAKMAFLMVNNFFLCVLKNTEQKNIRASIVSKAESKPKHEEKVFFGGFSSKTKNALFQGSKMVLLKSQISNL